MLDAGALSLIVRAGAGYNTIDVAAASRRGIYVSNCPGKNAVAVAELTLGLILSLDRRIPDNVAELRAGTLEQEGVREGRAACTAGRSACSATATSAGRWRSGRTRSACRRRLEPRGRAAGAERTRRCAA